MPWCSSRHQVRSYCCQSVRQMVLCKPFVRWTVSQPERWPWDPGKFYTTGSSNIAVAGKWRPRIESMYFLLNIGIFQPAMLAFSLPEGNILNPKVMEVDGFRWFSFFNLGSFRRSIFRGAKGGNPTMKGFFLGELKPWKPFLKVVTLKVAERHHFLWVNPTTFSSFWVTFCLGETTPSIELWATNKYRFCKRVSWMRLARKWQVIGENALRQAYFYVNPNRQTSECQSRFSKHVFTPKKSSKHSWK